MAEVLINDVAKLAGVSIATVSRCINSPHQVRPRTREKVEKAIAATNYSPNTLARDFRRGKTKMIMVVIPGVGDPFFTLVMKGIRRTASSEGYSLLIHENVGNNINADKINELMVSKHADGIILLASVSPFGTELLSSGNDRRIPMVIGCELLSPELNTLPNIHIDNTAAAAEATQHLIELGHRRIAFICGDRDSLLTADRQAGYQLAMQRAKLHMFDEWIREGGMSIDGARRATTELLALPNPPTAIFCANDEMALGCLHELRSLNKSVPEDISVVGFDNTRYAEVSSPPLTTIHQPAETIGERTVHRLIDEIGRNASEPKESMYETVPYELVVRQSTAKPRGA
ncbi:LacI family DNA-binding transcriptional regulator [Agarilytica rhodophyticola]|uniref:LacI family DNA-binding transcriptional regulator n=1 Tax=Agarilytica rhodophyticola TaxID=1737490 RepID=UPI000B3455CA|nr:LacI family DNA-binding transcriptional regulator [Agarilytica rhodophyticola]